MWTFKTLGETPEPNGFDATFDGPVEDAEAALQVITKRAGDLKPEAAELCRAAATLTRSLVVDTENGKRRLSMNLGGGVNANQGWSMTLMLNLADAP